MENSAYRRNYTRDALRFTGILLLLLTMIQCRKEPVQGWHYWFESPPMPVIEKVTPVIKNCEPPYPVSFRQECLNLLGNVKYHWDFGDGTTSADQNPIHIYTTEGEYVVRLIVSNEIGSDTATLTVDGLNQASIPVEVQYQFSHFNNNNFAPARVIFQNESSGANQFYWHFGDGIETGDESPAHDFLTAGTYSVSLHGTCTNGTSDDFTQQILVMPPPGQIFIDSLTLMLPSGYSANGIYLEFYHNTTYTGHTRELNGGSFPVKFRRQADFTAGSYFDFVQYTPNEVFRFVILRNNGSQQPDFIGEIMLSSIDISNNHYPSAYFNLSTVPVVKDLFIDLYLKY